MIRIYRDVLLDLDIVDTLKNREPVPDADNRHFLQFFMP